MKCGEGDRQSAVSSGEAVCFGFVLFFLSWGTVNRALLRPSYDGLIIHAVEQANKYKCEKKGESLEERSGL